MNRLVAFCLLLSCLTTHAQQRSRPRFNTQIDRLGTATLSQPTAGLSIAIARNGHVIFARGYGLANVEHSVPVTPQTVFHICSVSKNILAAVVLRLAEEGKLKLDDDVTKYVPEAPTHGRAITIRQLLNHTSGIFSFTSLPDGIANEALDLDHEQVLALFRDHNPDFEPGEKWRYDNSAFYLAGMVVERVTGQDYGEYVRAHIFNRLGMTSAKLCDARKSTPNLATGYERQHGKLVNPPPITWKLPWAAGAVCMTATDLAKWQTALDRGAVLSRASLRVMRTPTILADGTSIDYGLGTRLGVLAGHRLLGHTGGGGGFAAVVESFPGDHLTIVVLMNTGNGADAALTLASAIARVVLGLPAQSSPDLPVPTAELDGIGGITFDSDEGPVEQFDRDGKLHFRIPDTPIEGVLQRQAPYVYAADENTEVHFLTREGKPKWATVYIAGMFMDAKYRVP